MRAFSAIPMHMFTGVILGWHVGPARFTANTAAARRWVAQGFLAAWLSRRRRPQSPRRCAPLRPARKAPRWMAVVVRILLALCALVWALLLFGVVVEKEEGSAWEIILDGVLLTFIPLGLGIVLEMSYRRRRAAQKVSRPPAGP